MTASSGRPRPGYLATVRRFEAAGFRAWPASSVQYDGAWLVRLTPAFPSNRLNSVNTLDPGDVADIERRVAEARTLFEASGRPLTFRISPLTGQPLSDYFDAQGWSRMGDTLTMSCDLAALDLDDAIDQIPAKSIARYTAAASRTQGLSQRESDGLAGVIGAVHGEAGLFVTEVETLPVSHVVCVQEGDLAGLFNMATSTDRRGEGHARRLLLSALKWARLRGAKDAWLQVEAGNEPALALYRSIGFESVYDYHYRQPA